jgi:hypothetical protein
MKREFLNGKIETESQLDEGIEDSLSSPLQTVKEDNYYGKWNSQSN